MSKIPYQFMLVFVVLTLVVFGNLAPGNKAYNRITTSQTVGETYVSPGQDEGIERSYIMLLRIDLTEVKVKQSVPNASGAVMEARQSYDSIAGQYDPRLLKCYGLPSTLN